MIIRIEVERVQHQLAVALDDFALQFDETVKSEVEGFFKYGAGRSAIRQAVLKKLTASMAEHEAELAELKKNVNRNHCAELGEAISFETNKQKGKA